MAKLSPGPGRNRLGILRLVPRSEKGSTRPSTAPFSLLKTTFAVPFFKLTSSESESRVTFAARCGRMCQGRRTVWVPLVNVMYPSNSKSCNLKPSPPRLPPFNVHLGSLDASTFSFTLNFALPKWTLNGGSRGGDGFRLQDF